MRIRLFSAALVACFVAPSAFSLPMREVDISYYADASMTHDVGFEVRPSCNGTPSPLNGRRTRFAVRVSVACHGGGGPSEVACYFNGVKTTCPANICDSPLVDCL